MLELEYLGSEKNVFLIFVFVSRDRKRKSSDGNGDNCKKSLVVIFIQLVIKFLKENKLFRKLADVEVVQLRVKVFFDIVFVDFFFDIDELSVFVDIMSDFEGNRDEIFLGVSGISEIKVFSEIKDI